MDATPTAGKVATIGGVNLALTLAKAAAGFAAGHGLIGTNNVEMWTGIIVLILTYGWSLWTDYGSVIAKASLDILRAKVLNAAELAQSRPAAAPAALAQLATHVEVTALGPAPVVTATPPVASAIALAIGLLVLASHPAAAQPRLPSAAPHANAVGQPCDPLNLIPGCKEQATSKGIDDLVSKLDTLSLPDFEFALAQAKAANNEVTQPCWSAWVDLIKARQAAALGPDGQPLPLPDPHIITAIERISELLAILRPDSKISLACVQIANVAGKDAATVLTGILSGGALGLFKLPIVPIP